MEYIFLFFIIFSPYIFKQNRISLFYNENSSSEHFKYNWKLYFFRVSIFMILLLTLRHDFVGTDTQNYRCLYDIFANMSFQKALIYINNPGFVYFFQLSSRLGLSFSLVLFIQAFFYIGSLTYIIKRYSKLPTLSYWIFLTMGYFIFATTMRQAIAMSFTLISYDFIKRKKKWCFLLFVGLASTFHLSAIIFLPAYWIDKFKYNRKTLLIIISIISIIILFKDQISRLMLGYTITSYEQKATGGYFLILFLVVLLALGIFYKKRFLVDENNKMLFFMIAASLALIAVARVNPVFFRITNYYQVFVILYVPNLITSLKDKMMKFILTYGFIVLGLYYFYFKLESYGIRMHPYIFWWQEYPIKIPGLN